MINYDGQRIVDDYLSMIMMIYDGGWRMVESWWQRMMDIGWWRITYDEWCTIGNNVKCMMFDVKCMTYDKGQDDGWQMT